jgi:hypothetical protein
MCEHTLRGSSLYSELDTGNSTVATAYRTIISVQLYSKQYRTYITCRLLLSAICCPISAAEGELSPALRPAIMSYLISTPHALCVSHWVEAAFRYSSRISSPSQYPNLPI